MFKKQVILLFKYFFYNDYINENKKIIGSYKESNLKEKPLQKKFNILSYNTDLDLSYVYVLYLLSLKQHYNFYCLFILLLK